MVAEQTKCYDRGSIGKHSSGNYLNNQCLPTGLGGYCGQEAAQGNMIPGTGTKLPYQCSKDVSSEGDDETLPYSDSGEACPDQVRQQNGSQLSQQARRYKISHSLRSNMAPFKVGQEATMHDHCYTSHRSNESEGRFLVKTQDLAHRVDAPSKAGAGDFQDLGETADRPVCSQNHHLPTFCAWHPSKEAYVHDAFSLSWVNLNAYAYPPICLIPRVLKQMECHQCQVILIAPLWPRRAWFMRLLDLLVDIPIILPTVDNLLQQGRGHCSRHKPMLR